MSLLLDSFWRAAAYCLHPRVVLLSLLPLLLMVAMGLGLGYFFWNPALDWVREMLDSWSLINTFWNWMQGLGIGQLKTVVAPLLVIFAVTPVIVVLALLVVALLMTPALVRLVAQRRFPALERRRGASLLSSIFWSVLSTVLALVALVVSVPLWFIPPLVLILPPLVWGWLTYRVMAYDALAEHASREERRELFRRHRGVLLGMGILCGYASSAPSLVWASGALLAAAFVVLVPLAIWIYTLVFAFSSLWFAHYSLGALEKLRAESATASTDTVIDVEALALLDEPQPAPPSRVSPAS